MINKSDFKIVTEGSTDVLVSTKKISCKGPGSKDKLPFYNPSMELNRDLSIVVCQWLVNNSKKPLCLVDGLAASGVRGLRLPNELVGDFDVTINDWNEDAYSLIEKNLKQIKQENVVAVNKNLNTLLSENRFDYIDIDPFGSPVDFVDSAMNSIRHNGIIAASATDTAALCGVYPKVCLRRYGVKSFHSSIMHETGLRILLGFFCREAAKFDKGIEPLVCYSTDHYFRVYIRVKNGVSYANSSLKDFSMVKSEMLSLEDTKNVDVGPMWVGKLQNKKVIEELRTILFEKKLNTKNMLWKMLDLLEEEAEAPAFYYNTEDFASVLKKSPPRMKTIFEELKNKGYSVYRTHFSPTGFKTDAPLDEIKKLF